MRLNKRERRRVTSDGKTGLVTKMADDGDGVRQ